MRMLNEKLRQFSYGTEDMYQEVAMSVKTVPKTDARVPRNQMYVFSTVTVYDENGRQIDEKNFETLAHTTGDQVVLVDLNDKFFF